jgi:hypothetical protein
MLFLSCVEVGKVQNSWIMIVILTYDIYKDVDNLVQSKYRENFAKISVEC